jgi:hypothetical protein
VFYEKIMEAYLNKHEELIGEQDAVNNDFSINNEEVGENIDKLARSFDNYKKTVSFAAIYHTIKQFEEINKRIDR